LGDDLAGVFDDDLVGLEAPHSPNTVTLTLSRHDLDTIIVPIAFCTLLQLRKRAIVALFRRKWAIGRIAFISHDAVVTGFPAAIFWLAETLSCIVVLLTPP
jgi:hypothetical protein